MKNIAECVSAREWAYTDADFGARRGTPVQSRRIAMRATPLGKEGRSKA